MPPNALTSISKAITEASRITSQLISASANPDTRRFIALTCQSRRAAACRKPSTKRAQPESLNRCFRQRRAVLITTFPPTAVVAGCQQYIVVLVVIKLSGAH